MVRTTTIKYWAKRLGWRLVDAKDCDICRDGHVQGEPVRLWKKIAKAKQQHPTDDTTWLCENHARKADLMW